MISDYVIFRILISLTKKGFKIGQNNLFKWLYKNKYLISNKRAYQRSLDNGWVEMDNVTYLDYAENNVTTQKVMITGVGQTYFTGKLLNQKSVELGQTSF